ncbi:MAG: peroxidase family protein [Planctomycetota bacterium]
MKNSSVFAGVVRAGFVSAAAMAAVAGSASSAFGQAEYRTFDGTGNNLQDTSINALGQVLTRAAANTYADGLGEVDMSLPNARELSNAVFASSGPDPDQRGLNELNWAFGQFMSHDISHVLFGRTFGSFGIEIPAGDPYFDNGTTNLGGETISVSRSQPSIGSSGVREQVNNVTGWIDGGIVYGGQNNSSPFGTPRTPFLRSFEGGRLAVTETSVGDLMPNWGFSTPAMANTSRPTMGTAAFVAGDVRANEHVGLLAMHTLFVREHNRIADAIAAADASLTDEEIYQRTRKIVGAQIQQITYKEYLPSLGVDLGAYMGYDEAIDASVSNEFATAAFRLGHSQVTGTILRLDENGNEIGAGHLDLAAAFFNPNEIYDGGLEAVLRGLAASTQESTDATLVDGLRNQLFEIFLPDVGLVSDGTDLAALNTARGRDHGLASLNDTRQAYGLARFESFVELTNGDEAVAAALASVYGDIDSVELWPGMLVEQNLPNASLSETTAVIVADQFHRLREGDRFWWEHDLTGVNSDLMDLEAAFDGENLTTAFEFLSLVGLSDIIAWNTDAELDPSVFFAQTFVDPCNAADIAEQYGVISSADITAFVQAFVMRDPAADLAPAFGVLNASDINAFVSAFIAGCP